MKKARQILSLFMPVCLMLGLAACGSNATSGPSSENGTDASMQESSTEPSSEVSATDTETGVLVAYFSITGNTKAVAEQIAELTGGNLYEIIPADPYTEEDLDYGNDQSRTSQEMDDPAARPEIGSEDIAMEAYTTLYLGYPIWHGQAPRIMDTFVEQYDFDGLTIIPFCTSGGSGIGSSAETLEELAGSGNWLEGQRFSAGTSEEELQEWMESVQ